MIATGAYVTHRGVVRETNEDAVVFGTIAAGSTMDFPHLAGHSSDSSWVIAVADGMGGNNAGQDASLETVKELMAAREFSVQGRDSYSHL